MRVLWLNAGLLLPLDKGGKLRTWHLMRHLARRHTITYLSFAEPDSPPESIEGMREVASRIETIPRRETGKSGLRFYSDVARHVFSPLPYAVGKYRSDAYSARVRRVLREQPFDVIVCDFLPPALHLPEELPCPAVLFTHNVEAEIWRRHLATQPTPMHRFLYRMQHRRMTRFEARTLRRFSGVLAVSEADAGTLARLYPDSLARPIDVIPTGVDTAFFSQNVSDEGTSASSRGLVFTGSMDWLPNVDAMRFFCEQILPRIRAEVPDVTLSIVGRAPTPSVRSLAQLDGVTVTGAVADVRPFIRDAAVYVVPLRIGGGTRLKIFEAMAMGKAVVSTAVGAEGLPVRDGTHLLLADDPPAFASAVVDLLRQPHRQATLGAAARTLVVERYDWAAAALVLEQALERAATIPGDRRISMSSTNSERTATAPLLDSPRPSAPVEVGQR